jgi:alkanesulfonate monooxygenase SsuD/methylene tetrahydromethanopterin reductase-like flavin-dependent oxidoreductase (luciferase family)
MPIWIGAQNGKEFMLRLTAKHGDGINIAWMTTPEDLERRFQRLANLAKKYGRDTSDIQKSVGLWTRIFESEDEMEAAIIENAKTRNISVDEYRERVAQALWGTPDYMVKRLCEFVKIGVTHFIFMFPHEQELAQIRVLGKSVLSKL